MPPSSLSPIHAWDLGCGRPDHSNLGILVRPFDPRLLLSSRSRRVLYSLRGAQDSLHAHTSPSSESEASPTVDRAIDRVAEARTESEADHWKTVQELSVKIQNLEGQIAGKAAEITSLELHHEHQLASILSDFESQKSQWAAAQTALEVEGKNTAANLRAKIAQLEQEIDDHNATVKQITDAHKRELEAARSNHHSALQTIQELSTMIQNLDGQITVNAAEIKSLELHHERQLASTSSDFESQKSQWAAAQTALEVEGENTAADLRARIAELKEQIDSHNATVEQITAGHQTELETERSRHHSALTTLTTIHEDTNTRLTKDLTGTQALATRLDTDLNRALTENQLLKSSKARSTEVESTQSATISELKTKLEEAANQLKDAIQEKAYVQNRLAAAEGEVESIRTRLFDAAREHTVVVLLADDMITKGSEMITALRSENVKQQGRAAQLASQMQLLKAGITTKDTAIFALKSSLSSATSRVVNLEARNLSNITTSAAAVAQPDVFDNEDTRSEVDVEATTSAISGSTADSLAGSQSMTRLSPTSSPDSPRRRHSVDAINKRAKQVSEEAAKAVKESLGVVAAEEAAVGQDLRAVPGSPEPSRNSSDGSEGVKPSLPEQGVVRFDVGDFSTPGPARTGTPAGLGC